MIRRETVTGGRPASTAIIPGDIALSVGNPETPTPEGFKWVKLTDMARIESGHTPSRSRSEYWNGSIPWVGIRDATANHGTVLKDTTQHITEAGLANSSARLLPAGTVCLSRTASVGYVVSMGVPMATSQDFVNWVCAPELSSRYLHYLLMVEQKAIRRFASGSVHQTMYYPEAKAITVCIPSRREQDRVTEILCALDDKIAANVELTLVAEELARAEYAKECLHASSAILLGELVLMITRGVTPSYTDQGDGLIVLNQKCVRGQQVSLVPSRRTSPHRVREEKILRKDDVLVNSTGVGTLGRVARWTQLPEATADSHVSIIRFDPEKVNCVCAGHAVLLAQPEIETLGEGSTGQTELSRVKLAQVSLLLPHVDAQSRLGGRLSRLSDVVDVHHRENEKLAEVRDTLLPALMSGKLRVKDAEKIVSDEV